MDVVISCVNKIRGGHNALSHRRFRNLLNEVKSQYKDLKGFTEVRWLSKGSCLNRFFELRDGTLLFLQEHG